MRIISDFHDYYDVMQRHDEDRQTLFMRNRITVKEKYEFRRVGYFEMSVRPNLLSFCGKIWPMLIFTRGPVSKPVDFGFFDMDSAIEHVRAHTRPARYRFLQRRKYGILIDIRRFFAVRDWKDHHPEVPIWIAASHETWLNPCLRESVPGFISLMPPPLAYQELVMWFGKRAAPEPPIPQIDDVTMAEAKGFDKFSFRKDPTKRKAKP